MYTAIDTVSLLWGYSFQSLRDFFKQAVMYYYREVQDNKTGMKILKDTEALLNDTLDGLGKELNSQASPFLLKYILDDIWEHAYYSYILK